MELEFRRYPKLIFNYANSIRRKHVRQKLFFNGKLFFLFRKLTKQQQLIQKEISYLVQYVDIKQSNE